MFNPRRRNSEKQFLDSQIKIMFLNMVRSIMGQTILGMYMYTQRMDGMQNRK